MRRATWLLAMALVVAVSGSVAPTADAATGEDSWVRAQTDNFTLLSNAEPERALELGRQLEQLRAVLSLIAPDTTLHSPLPTKIYVFKNSKSFAPYNLRPDGSPDDHTLGYFIRGLDGNYLAIDASSDDSSFSVIYHEYLHYVLENNFPALPLWLNEGIAEFYSTFQVSGTEARIGLPIADHTRWLRVHDLLSLDDLFAMDTDSADYNEGERRGTFYAQSWALAHQLMVAPEFRDKSSELLRLLGQGESSIDVFRKLYDADLVAMERKLVEYVGAGVTKLFSYKLADELSEGELKVASLAQKEVLFHLGDLLTHLGPHQAGPAEKRLLQALALDEKYVDARVGLALLRMTEERFDEANELCRAALALEPTNPVARTLLGASLLTRFHETAAEEGKIPTETPPLLLEAREHFLAALETAPDHVESLIGLGQTYRYESGDVGPGVSALAKAQHAFPARTDILRELIVVTGRSGNMTGARSLLDRGLRPRGDAEETRLAEFGLAQVEYETILPLLEGGQLEEGRERLRALAEWIQDSELKQDLLEQAMLATQANQAQQFLDLREQAIAAAEAGDEDRARELLEQAASAAERSESRGEEIELYNEAVQLHQQGRVDEALEAFDDVAESATLPDLRERARVAADGIRSMMNRNRHVDRFNEAVSRYNEGEHADATGILEALLDEPLDRDLRESAEELLRNMRRASEGVLGSREVWFSLFPVHEAVTGVPWERCAASIDEFLDDATSDGVTQEEIEAMKTGIRDTAACHPQTPFHVGGVVMYDTALMRVGAGVYPYVAITQSQQLDLHVAVVVPARAGDEIAKLSFLADGQSVAEVPASAAITHQVLQMAQGGGIGFIAFDLSKESLGLEILERLADAKKAAVEFGPASRQRIKISKRNAATIEAILGTYASMRDVAER